jgi:hypothetical protein
MASWLGTWATWGSPIPPLPPSASPPSPGDSSSSSAPQRMSPTPPGLLHCRRSSLPRSGPRAPVALPRQRRSLHRCRLEERFRAPAPLHSVDLQCQARGSAGPPLCGGHQPSAQGHTTRAVRTARSTRGALPRHNQHVCRAAIQNENEVGESDGVDGNASDRELLMSWLGPPARGGSGGPPAKERRRGAMDSMPSLPHRS